MSWTLAIMIRVSALDIRSTPYLIRKDRKQIVAASAVVNVRL